MYLKTKKDIYNFILKNYSALNDQIPNNQIQNWVGN